MPPVTAIQLLASIQNYLIQLDAKFNRLNQKFDVLLGVTKALLQEEAHVSQQLDDLQAQVAENTSVEQSALTLIQGLHDQLEAASDDPAKLSALKDQLKSSAEALAAAVAANTTPA